MLPPENKAVQKPGKGSKTIKVQKTVFSRFRNQLSRFKNQLSRFKN
jgi:hypothetical protein